MGALGTPATAADNPENKQVSRKNSGALLDPPDEDSSGEDSSVSSSEARAEKAMEARLTEKILAAVQAKIDELEARNQVMARRMVEAGLEADARILAMQGAQRADEEDAEETARQAGTGEEEEEEAGSEEEMPITFSSRTPKPVRPSGALLPPAHSAPGGAAVSAALGGAPQQFTLMAVPPPPRPPVLAYKGVEDAVETWLKQYRTWFRAARITDEEDKVMQAVATMDAFLQSWWERRAESKVMPRAFDLLEKALMSGFVRVDVSERATKALRALSMPQSEDPHQYFTRVGDLLVKARVSDSDAFVLGLVFEKFDQARWPMAASRASEAIRAGKITKISALHEYLATKVMCEPRLARPAAQAPPKQQQQQQTGKGQNRLSALEGDGQAASESATSAPGGLEARMDTLVKVLSAMSARGPSSRPDGCLRCGDKGHSVGECKKPDTRVCYKCQKTGHIARNCKGGAAQSEGQPPKPPLNG